MLFLDANVWLPLVWDGHTASDTVCQWVDDQSDDFVMCRVMHLALLRHLTNPSIMAEDVCTNVEASKILTALCSQDHVLFQSDPLGIGSLFPGLSESETPNCNRWTDAYLAAFAIAGDYELVTFDRGFSRYEQAGLRLCLLEM